MNTFSIHNKTPFIRLIGERYLMSRVVKTSEQRQLEIIQVAETLFIEKGYNNVSTNEIVKKAGVAKGTLFYHFESKEKLADAIISYQLAPIYRNYEKVDQKDEWDSLQKISWFFLSELEDSINHVSQFNYLKNDDNAILRQKLRIEMTKQFVPFLSSWLTKGHKTYFPTIDNPHLMAEFIFTTFHSWIENSLFGDNLELRHQRIHYALPLFNTLLQLPENTLSPDNMKKRLTP